MLKDTEEKGITLIALVITIIILLILAGIFIGMLTGENGILTKAKEAKETSKKAEYQEEVELIITQKKIEKATNIEEKRKLIELVAEEIRQKEWQESTTICDDNENEDINPSQGTKIIVETKDNYEIIVEIKDEKCLIEINKIEGPIEMITVTFNENGGVGTCPAEIERKKGRSITLPGAENLNKEYYKLVGWSENPLEEPEDVKLKVGSNFKLTNHTTLYAIWAYDTVEIYFDSNVGTGTMEKINVVKGKNTNLPSNKFIREGYQFKEWNTKEDGSGTSYSNEGIIRITENITLFAIWDRITYAVTYNANGGIGAPAEQTKYYGEPITLSTTKPTKIGYTFVNWKGSDGKTYEAGGSYATDAILTLTAQWQIESVPLVNRITARNYGDKINYSANGLSDWSIYLCNENGIYIICDQLLGYSSVQPGSTITKGEYNCITGTNGFTFNDWMNDANMWRNFATRLYWCYC